MLTLMIFSFVMGRWRWWVFWGWWIWRWTMPVPWLWERVLRLVVWTVVLPISEGRYQCPVRWHLKHRSSFLGRKVSFAVWTMRVLSSKVFPFIYYTAFCPDSAWLKVWMVMRIRWRQNLWQVWRHRFSHTFWRNFKDLFPLFFSESP